MDAAVHAAAYGAAHTSSHAIRTEVTGSTALPLVLLSATLYSLYRWPYLRSVCWQVCSSCATPHVVGLCVGRVVCVFVPSGASIIYPRPEQYKYTHDRVARTQRP